MRELWFAPFSGGTFNHTPLLHHYTTSGKNNSDSNSWSLIILEGKIGSSFLFFVCLVDFLKQQNLLFWNVKLLRRWRVSILPVNFLTLVPFVKCEFPVPVSPCAFFPSELKHVPILCCPRQTRHIFLDSINITQAAKELIIKWCKVSFFTSSLQPSSHS